MLGWHWECGLCCCAVVVAVVCVVAIYMRWLDSGQGDFLDAAARKVDLYPSGCAGLHAEWSLVWSRERGCDTAASDKDMGGGL